MPKAGQLLKTTIIGFCGPWAQGLGPKGPGKGGPWEGPAGPREKFREGPREAQGRPREGPGGTGGPRRA